MDPTVTAMMFEVTAPRPITSRQTLSVITLETTPDNDAVLYLTSLSMPGRRPSQRSSTRSIRDVITRS